MMQSPRSLSVLEILSQQDSPSSIISDTYKLNIENFVTVLKKVGDHPFAAYCMSGTSRIGKSYTLNFFIRKLGCQVANSDLGSNKWFDTPLQDMFGWRHGRKRETVGINLWSEPFFVSCKGKRVAIILMDGQGLFDNETTFQQNAVIFSLCSLLSSVCIFNVMKKIHADTLQHLQFFSDYSRAIGKRQDDDAFERSPNIPSSTGEADEIQKLVILVRDFDDVDEYDFGYHDKNAAPQSKLPDRRNYYHDIMLIDSDAKIPVENRATVQGIRENYGNIGIFLLPDPGKQFRMSPQTNAPDLDFQEHLMEFVDLMTSEGQLTTKRVGGHEITGKDFIPYVKYLDFICQHAKDSFPSARTIGESTVVMANTLAISNAYKVFVKKFTQFLNNTPNATEAYLEARYKVVLQEAQDAFGRMKKMGGKVVEEMCRSELSEKCLTSYHSMKQMYELKKALKASEDNYNMERKKTVNRMSELEAEIDEMKKTGKDHRSMMEELRRAKETLEARDHERVRQINELKAAQQRHNKEENDGYIEVAKKLGAYFLGVAMELVLEFAGQKLKK